MMVFLELKWDKMEEILSFIHAFELFEQEYWNTFKYNENNAL